jgi:dTDP-4-dehydrorhamnose 3,5-epimerase
LEEARMGSVKASVGSGAPGTAKAPSELTTTPLSLAGLLLIALPVWRDERGFFVERFHQARFGARNVPTRFVQDNQSRSMPGVLRGLHFQDGPPQGKLVGVTRGRIWDVVVDIRPDSPTFGRSAGIELNDENGRLLWVPGGFAHGFCVLGDEPADVLYKVDTPYNPAREGGIFWGDEHLAIRWPIDRPIVSRRDAALPRFLALTSPLRATAR